MKISKVIKELANILSAYGDLDVVMSFVSKNGDLDFDKFTIEEWIGLKRQVDKVCFTYDIENLKEFKQQLKYSVYPHK